MAYSADTRSPAFRNPTPAGKPLRPAPAHPPRESRLTHLKHLESESIHIIREVVSEFERPVMLYSIGKDSAVMLHLAMKA
ncbi:MAG: phosphoadenosine phosphosulfate reductase family protein, partial [Methylococcus sp.]|nr:phosphoadenosine phosphosulfate reductase family protein [Methylococcus sp.]